MSETTEPPRRSTVWASCEKCRWQYLEADYREKRSDQTDSRIAIVGRQGAIHSRLTGHAVKFARGEP